MQITRTTPFRLMILHLSQIFLTLARTFMILTACLRRLDQREIKRRKEARRTAASKNSSQTQFGIVPGRAGRMLGAEGKDHTDGPKPERRPRHL